MRQTIFTLAVFLAIVQAVLAQLHDNGDYRIYYGNYQVTSFLRTQYKSSSVSSRVNTHPIWLFLLNALFFSYATHST